MSLTSVVVQKKCRDRDQLWGVSPALLVDFCGVQGGRTAEQRHLTGSHFGIQGGMCVNERLDQLCGGPHLFLYREKKNTLHTRRKQYFFKWSYLSTKQAVRRLYKKHMTCFVFLKLRSFRWRKHTFMPSTHTHTHLLLIDVVSREINIHSILVVHDPPDPGHGCIEQALLLIKRSLLLSIWQWTRVWQEVHVCHLKVSYTCRE